MAERQTEMSEISAEAVRPGYPAKLSEIPEFEKPHPMAGEKPADASFSDGEYAEIFAKLIAQSAKDIGPDDGSIPDDETAKKKAEEMLKGDVDEEAVRRLEDIVRQGAQLLEQIQDAFYDVLKAANLPESS